MTDSNEIFIERVNGLFVQYTLQNHFKWACKCNQVNKNGKKTKERKKWRPYTFGQMQQNVFCCHVKAKWTIKH